MNPSVHNNGVSSDEQVNEISELCCLVEDGEKCNRSAGNASFSKRIQKNLMTKKLKFTIDPYARSQFICDYHKSRIQTLRSKRRARQSDDSDDTDEETGLVDVDFYSLQVQTLRRYKKFYKVSTRPGMNKSQLADIISKHFKQIPVKEKEVLTYFIYTVKNNPNGTSYD